MRFLAVATAPILVPLALYFYDPQPFNFLARKVRASATTTFFGRDISFEGLNYLAPTEVEKLLPFQNSNIWWRLNQSSIESALMRHQSVAKAALTPCSWASLTCYRIAIEERVPSLVVQLGQSAWLVSTDGVFLQPITSARAASEKLCHVAGSLLSNSSPDQVKGLVFRSAELVKQIKSETKLKPILVQVLPGGDLEVEFESYDFHATFGASGANSENVDEELKQQVLRLSQVVKEMGENANRLKSVDLAYQKLAVVRVQE